MDAAVLELLRDIRREVRDLRRAVEGRRCSDADLRKLETLLPAVAGKFGSAPTTTAEMRRDPGVRAVGPPSSRAFGSLLSKAAHEQAVTSGGLTVTVVGREANKLLFQIVRALPRSSDFRPVEGV